MADRPLLTWTVEVERSAGGRKRLDTAVAAAAYWADLLGDFVQGAIALPVRLMVTTGVPAPPAIAPDGSHVTAGVPVTPESLRLTAPVLGTLVLDAALGVLDEIAHLWPVEPPVPRRRAPDPDEITGHRASVDGLEPEEVLVLAPEPRDLEHHHAIDQHLVDRVDASGAGAVDDLSRDGTFTIWVLVTD